ncbi:MAG TPA: AI-2E family transporter [Terriglobales bacterium]|nr:AI-2E family transporter [Terriglobales bacterium]
MGHQTGVGGKTGKRYSSNMKKPDDIPSPPTGESPGVASPTETPIHWNMNERRPAPDLHLIRAGAIIITILGLLALLHFASSVFITLFSAMLLAFALEPIVHFFCVRTRLQRHHSSAVVVFLFVALLYGLFYATYLHAESFLAEIPVITEKIRSAPMVVSLKNRAEELNRAFAEAGRHITPPAAVSASPKIIPPIDVRAEAETLTGSLLRGLGSMGGVLFALGFIPFLVYFILADREPLTRRTRELFPEKHRATVERILIDIERMMRKFLLGNAVIALFLSTVTVLVFLLVGLPDPVVLGIMSGTLSIVPYLGLPLALLPGGIVGLVFFESGGPFLAVVVSVTVLHLVAANYLTPKLVGGEVRLNAIASTAALLFFGWLWGGMGLVLGIPILAVLKCIFDNIPSTQRIGMFLGV